MNKAQETVQVSKKTLETVTRAMRAAVSHLVECEAGRLNHPYKSTSLPLLQDAIETVEKIH